MHIIHRNFEEESKRVSLLNKTRSPLIERNKKVRASRRSQKDDTSPLKTIKDKKALANKPMVRVLGLGKRQKLAEDQSRTCVQDENDNDSLWTNRSLTLFQPSIDSTADCQRQNLWNKVCADDNETTKSVRFEEDMGIIQKMKRGIRQTAMLLGEQVDKVVKYGIDQKGEYDGGKMEQSSS